MAWTEVDIANSALINLGAEPIMSFDDDSKEARACKNRYARVRDIVLRMHPWNRAIRRVITAPLADDTPAFGFTYKHQLPADCLRILSIDPEQDYEFRLEGKQIFTDSTALEVKYVAAIEDVAQFDDLLCEAIAMYLAWTLAYFITQSNSVKKQMWEDLQMIMMKAKSTDAQEDYRIGVEASEWVEARDNYTEEPLRKDR